MAAGEVVEVLPSGDMELVDSFAPYANLIEVEDSNFGAGGAGDGSFETPGYGGS